jgi:Protein of unknown function (DUF3631)
MNLPPKLSAHGSAVLAAARAPVPADPWANAPPPEDEWCPHGSVLLDQVEAMLARFVAFPSDEARIAVTLWVAHTHALTAFECTPRLAFLSPEPGSGKTRAMEILELLVLRPLLTVNVTPAYLFRKVADEQGPPTILYDEIDTVFGPKAKDNEDIRGMLNAGYRRGATAGRCVIKGKTVEVEELPAFAAVALAGLDDLPDTIMSRSIVIRMRRRAPSERIESYRRRVHQDEGHELRDQLAAWVSVVRANLQDAWPDLPKSIEDRNADVWEPLLAIADAAGGHWPERARATAVTLVKAAQTSAGGFGVQLLADLRTVFGDEPAMTTEAIIEALCALDESPWADIRGKALDARSLSRRLGKYGIKPKVIRLGDKTHRGYDRADLHDSWVRYLPDLTVTDVTDVTEAGANGGADVTDAKAISMKSDPTHPGEQSPAVTTAPLLPQASVTSVTTATPLVGLLDAIPVDPPRPTCTVCNQLLLMTLAGRTVCAARDAEHDAARAAEAVA